MDDLRKAEFSPDKKPKTVNSCLPLTSKGTNTQTINLVLSPVSVCSVPEQVPFQNIPQPLTQIKSVTPFTHRIPPGAVTPIPVYGCKESELNDVSNVVVFGEDVTSEIILSETTQLSDAEEEEAALHPHEETSFSSMPCSPESLSFDVFENRATTTTCIESNTKYVSPKRENHGTGVFEIITYGNSRHTLSQFESNHSRKTSDSDAPVHPGHTSEDDPYPFSPNQVCTEPKVKRKVEII